MCRQCYGITDDYNRCEIKHWTRQNSNGRYYCRHHLNDPNEYWKRDEYNYKINKFLQAMNNSRLEREKLENIKKEKEEINKRKKMRNEIIGELYVEIELELRNKIMLELANTINEK